MGASTLRQFILVMRKDQVEPAAVNVDRLAQMRADHRRTFDMPPRPPATPRRIPADHAIRARFPQHEIGWVALVRRDFDPRAGDHRIAVAPAKRAIIRVAGDRKQHMALGGIGVALANQRIDHRHHWPDFLGRVRGDVGRSDAKRAHVVKVMTLVPLGDHRRVDSLRLGRRNDLVVDVGDVAGIGQAVGAILMPNQPRQRIEHHRRPRIADMGSAIDGRAAHIHGDPLGIGGFELALGARHRVVKLDHGCTRRWRRVSTQSTTARPLALSNG